MTFGRFRTATWCYSPRNKRLRKPTLAVLGRCHARPVGPKHGAREVEGPPGKPEQETDAAMTVTQRSTEPPSTRSPRGAARVRAGKIVANLSTAALYEAAIRDGEGTDRGGGAARREHGHAHRPLAKGQVHRPRAIERGECLVGRRQPPDQRGPLRPASGAPHDLRRAIVGSTARTCSSARTRTTAARSGSTPRLPGRASSPATCSGGPRRR